MQLNQEISGILVVALVNHFSLYVFFKYSHYMYITFVIKIIYAVDITNMFYYYIRWSRSCIHYRSKK
jgi:hypothetical protein